MKKIEIIILDGQTLRIKDFTFTTDYTICFDSLVQNASNFSTNKRDIDAETNDIIMTRGWDKIYVGIVGKISGSNGIITITTYQFSKKFDTSFIDTSKENVNLGEYIKNIITDNLIASADPFQNIPYLKIENEAEIIGSVALTENSGSNIMNVIADIQKGYELMITYEPDYDTNGTIKGVLMTIMDPPLDVKTIKEKEKFVTDAEVEDGSIGAVNKLIYYPNADNILYKETLYYFLLRDGVITDNPTADGRITPVVSEINYYTDKDVYGNAKETFIQKVKTTFAKTTYNHRIKFELNENKVMGIAEFDVGERVDFISKDGKVYRSIITKINYSSKTGKASLELGFNRKSLTDKLALKGA